MGTHDVVNQPPPLEDYNAFASDPALVDAVAREGAVRSVPQLVQLGARAGSPEAIAWGAEANENPPVLRAFDRFGHRIDEVAYHPSYHHLMAVAVGEGLHGRPWAATGERPGAHVARAAGFYLWSQVD